MGASAKDEFTPEEWEEMNEAERQAIEADDPQEGEGEEGGGVENDDEGVGEGDDAGDDADGKADPADPAPGDAGDKSSEPLADKNTAPSTPPKQETSPKVETPPAVEDPNAEKRKELADSLGTLKEKFEEGEIAFEDYLDQRDEVKDTLRSLDLKESIRREMEEDRRVQTEQELTARWEQDQKTFFSQNSDLSQDKDLMGIFAQQANIKIQDPAWDAVPNGKLLEQAAAEARAIHAAAGVVSGEKDKKGLIHKRQEANREAGKKTVQTLSGMPASKGNEDAGAEFEYLDRLLDEGKVEKLEAAIAKLTPDQEERYLSR